MANSTGIPSRKASTPVREEEPRPSLEELADFLGWSEDPIWQAVVEADPEEAYRRAQAQVNALVAEEIAQREQRDTDVNWNSRPAAAPKRDPSLVYVRFEGGADELTWDEIPGVRFIKGQSVGITKEQAEALFDPRNSFNQSFVKE